MPRPLVATIDISALRHNLAVARRQAGGAKVWAVVKADAYGHGLARGMRGFADADGLALIEPDYAVRLRELGWRKPVLLLEGFFDKADLLVAVQHEFQVVVHCEEQIALLETALPAGAQLDVHLKMNSGMNRLGFKPAIYHDAHARLRRIAGVRGIALITHLANADEADNPALPLARQLTNFAEGAQDLPGQRSVANSAADLLHPEAAADWVRAGIMLYGGTPCSRAAAEFDLLPAMTLRSEIIGVQNLDAGDAVGYGSRFVAPQPMRIGVVACGYADGYPRHAPTGTPVLVNGVRTSTLGRISMDMLMVDLSGIADAAVGSPVVLWGEGLPIDEVANAAGTIGYELMCALAARVHIEQIEQNNA
ncbi:alanine racemase [Oxalobacteraceae bacterium CAVE-383]|nr:alanine racemase [Oxalobacteraceae bacterium CAVE-383]